MLDGDEDDVRGAICAINSNTWVLSRDDNLAHNKRLADVFFKELHKIEEDGYYYILEMDKYFLFEIISRSSFEF